LPSHRFTLHGLESWKNVWCWLKIVVLLRQFKESHEKDVERPAVVEKPIPHISNDNFSQEGIFHYCHGPMSGHAHVNPTYLDVVRMWIQFMVTLHLEAG
jgi:hypothetical protein